MARHGRWRQAWMLVWIGAGVAVGVGGLARAGAAENETRIFTVKIDGKRAGTYRMKIGCSADGTFTMEGQADIATSYLLIKYKYTYQGIEVWKNGRLVRLQSNANDNGKHYDVLASAEGDELRVRVNGKDGKTRPDVWTTTYWRLPEALSASQAVALLDCDTGKELQGNVQLVGTQPLAVAGQTQPCAHYQIRGAGGLHVDVWYDAQKRLVRQDALDDGHQVVLELTRIDR